MTPDLFAALNVSKVNDLIYTLEHRIDLMFRYRHDYPIWPQHDSEMDEFELGFHEPMRHTYYLTTKVLIQTLRDLKASI